MFDEITTGIDRFMSALKNHIDVKEENMVYHYTSHDGLEAIFETSCLRFGDYRYFNDISEVDYAWNIFLEQLKEKKSSSSVFTILEEKIQTYKYSPLKKEYFIYRKKRPRTQGESEIGAFKDNARFMVFCCSKSPDDKDLWHQYASKDNGYGYCIGFDVINLTKKIENDASKIIYNRDNFKKIYLKQFYYGNVIYSREDQIQIISEYLSLIEDFFSSYTDDQINLYLSEINLMFLLNPIEYCSIFLKDPCFQSEQEYRFVFAIPESCFDRKNITTQDIKDTCPKDDKESDPPKGNETDPKSQVVYAKKNGAFIPKFDLHITNATGINQNGITEVIKNIRIGPPLYRQDITYNGLRDFLLRFGVEEPNPVDDFETKTDENNHIILTSHVPIRY